ncbi:MAG TPA: hypothetical protein VKK81_24645 [Candidatus Binatia bacterium]|nr:hypothetical protein [Candidatus Binatia bacterium]
MRHRMLPLGVGLLTLALAASTLALAADSHQGKVVSAGDGKLTMTDTAGQHQHSHEVAADAAISCEGKPCGLTDLKAGDTITVTLDKKGDKMVATKIEAKKAGS